MDNLFIIGFLLICLYLTYNKQNIEHMTDSISESLLTKITELNNSNNTLSAQVIGLKGIIVAWNGSTPPTGWALCDGTNGTPNLSGRFILGYSPDGITVDNGPVDAFNPTGGGYYINAFGIGKVGGESIHSLTTYESPVHYHYMFDGSGKQTTAGNYANPEGSPGLGASSHSGKDKQLYAMALNDTTDATNYAATYGTTSKSGGGSYHNNMPPYYVLAYIMKL